uniref:replication stress response regulator SDE2-like n=1 Tax=Styela clava TaxID=7725 RepID=UPI001939C142|nr:replication stress response regulator SDE2-like [Styela clava]
MDKKVFVRLHDQSMKTISREDISFVGELSNHLQLDDYYVVCEGKVANDGDVIIPGKCYSICLRLRGGKGGFGSMLRAIGAQIEKTTNREACRDLSGRRMRDVNNEKRMVEYLEKKAERERDREKKRIEKLERLTQQPKHFFNDPDYESKLREAVENVDNAVEKGIIAHTKKRKSNPNEKQKEPKIKKGLWLGEEPMSDSDSDNDDIDELKSASRLQSSSTKHGLELGASTSKNNSVLTQAHTSAKSSSVSGISTIESDSVSSGSTSAALPTPEDSNNKLPETIKVPDTSGSKTTSETNEETKVIGNIKNENTGKESANECNKINNSQNQNEIAVINSVEKDDTSKELLNVDDIDLSKYSTADELASLGLETLKSLLMKKGVKCGGSLEERASRLFTVKDLAPEKIDPSLLATKSKKRNRSKK